jgi:hypothetical protein
MTDDLVSLSLALPSLTIATTTLATTTSHSRSSSATSTPHRHTPYVLLSPATRRRIHRLRPSATTRLISGKPQMDHLLSFKRHSRPQQSTTTTTTTCSSSINMSATQTYQTTTQPTMVKQEHDSVPVQAPVREKKLYKDPYYGQEETAKMSARFIISLFNCPIIPPQTIPNAPQPSLAHFIAVSLTFFFHSLTLRDTDMKIFSLPKVLVTSNTSSSLCDPLRPPPALPSQSSIPIGQGIKRTSTLYQRIHDRQQGRL